MLLDDGFGFETYKGIMKEEKVTVAFSWADEEDGDKTRVIERFLFYEFKKINTYHNKMDLYLFTIQKFFQGSISYNACRNLHHIYHSPQ